jgi:hypothetical protein
MPLVSEYVTGKPFRTSRRVERQWETQRTGRHRPSHPARPQGTGMSGPDNQLVNGLAGDGDSLIGVGSTNDYASMHTTLRETTPPRQSR